MGKSHDKKMDALKRVDKLMSSTIDLDELLKQIMKASQEVTNAEANSLKIRGKNEKEAFSFYCFDISAFLFRRNG